MRSVLTVVAFGLLAVLAIVSVVLWREWNDAVERAAGLETLVAAERVAHEEIARLRRKLEEAESLREELESRWKAERAALALSSGDADAAETVEAIGRVAAGEAPPRCRRRGAESTT